MKRKRGNVTVFLIGMLLLNGIANAFAAGQPTITVKLAVGDPINSSVGVTARHFADAVLERTASRVKVQVYPDGTLFGGDQNAAINMVEDGGLDAIILSTSVYASFEPKMNAISLPYLFKNYEEFQKYLDGEPGKELLNSLDRLNTVGLSLMIRTFRSVTNSKRPIEKPSDFKGIKLRVPNNKLWVEFFGSLGADPTPMNFKEVYTALQLKTIDGQENPVEVPLANKFYEVQQYLSLTNHIADAYILAFNKNLWNKFDDETKRILKEVALETAQFKLKYDISQEADIIKQLQSKGMKVNYLTQDQVALFQKAAIDLYPRFESMIGSDFLKKSLNFLGK